MCIVDQDVALEALSALTGATVKPYNAHQVACHSDKLLNICNLIIHVLDKNCSGLNKELYVDTGEFFHSKYDYDFRHCKDKSTCLRGDEPYKRLSGWYRIALRVLDKYPDGNVWLGKNGWRSNSMAGEWPVSYHGNTFEWARGENRRGIYSTYDLDKASCYCTEFKSVKTGKNFRVNMQNRINHQMRTTCNRSDYWMIEVPPRASPGAEREIVEKSLRTYGILLKEI